MTSLQDLRPKRDPLPLEQVLTECTVDGYLDPTGKPVLSDTLPPDLAQFPVNGVTVDSADMAPGWVFVAIGGARHHGIRFAQEAIEAGATAVVTDQRGLGEAGDLAVPTVSITNPRLGAAQMAHQLYEPLFRDLKLISVTGTNGKTTTTYLLRNLLQPVFGEVALMGTVEIAVGGGGMAPIISERTTPESPVVYRALAVAAENGYRAALVESSSHAVSFDRVAELHFDGSVFTNLQHDHLDYYGSMENYFAAKAELFTKKTTDWALVCVDDRWGESLALNAQVPTSTVSALSKTPAALVGRAGHWEVTSIEEDPDHWGVGFTLVDPSGETHACFCPVPGRVNVQNSAAALAGAVHFGVDLEEAIELLGKTAPPPGRMEKVPGISRQPDVVVDYAHTPEALTAALTTIRPLVRGNLTIVFGSDGDRDAIKRPILGEIAAELADLLWITDENPRTEDAPSIRSQIIEGVRRVRPDLHGVVEVTTCRRDAIRRAILAGKPGDLVVITGMGAEAYQEIEGVSHAHLDSKVAAEVLAATSLF